MERPRQAREEKRRGRLGTALPNLPLLFSLIDHRSSAFQSLLESILTAHLHTCTWRDRRAVHATHDDLLTLQFLYLGFFFCLSLHFGAQMGKGREWEWKKRIDSSLLFSASLSFLSFHEHSQFKLVGSLAGWLVIP